MSGLVVRITRDGENVTRIEFRRGLRWLPLTPDNAMFADAELFDAAQRHVFRLINEDLRRQAEGEA